MLPLGSHLVCSHRVNWTEKGGARPGQDLVLIQDQVGAEAITLRHISVSQSEPGSGYGGPEKTRVLAPPPPGLRTNTNTFPLANPNVWRQSHQSAPTCSRLRVFTSVHVCSRVDQLNDVCAKIICSEGAGAEPEGWSLRRHPLCCLDDAHTEGTHFLFNELKI
ncbi:hypothetical protein INR49_011616 [Caranx melampygus]|nr:hypothetical protein INR49_011616 [Caranx melampygus]